MSSEIAKRLRGAFARLRDVDGEGGDPDFGILFAAADRLDALEAMVDELRESLGQQQAIAYNILSQQFGALAKKLQANADHFQRQYDESRSEEGKSNDRAEA